MEKKGSRPPNETRMKQVKQENKDGNCGKTSDREKFKTGAGTNLFPTDLTQSITSL